MSAEHKAAQAVRKLESPTRLFSPDYVTARARFRAAARAAGAALDTLTLDAKGPLREDLTIDIAWLGAAEPRNVVLHTSGLHGVEAFAGSAIQLAVLESPPALEADCALVLVHVLNPYGMAWLRRTNENNVDLNRNFIVDETGWTGAPGLYRSLDRLLNPPTPPAPDFFYARALWHVCRYGFRALKQAVAQGQYEFPRGLFFGGTRLEQGPALYLQWLESRFQKSEYLFALDVHTGLGRSGEDTLLPEASAKATPRGELAAALGVNRLEAADPSGVAYEVRGGMGTGLPGLLRDVAIDFVVQEIGTYPPLAVIHALREENRWHHHGSGGLDHPSKRRLREALCPAAPAWRARALERGLRRVHAAAEWTCKGRDRQCRAPEI